MNPKLGCCYYPEHWPEDQWQDDARRMVELGLTWVRIGEFAWSRIEPFEKQYKFDWLDRAIDVLASYGLKIIMCTPTATPPRWMLNKHPEMLALDKKGRARGFGSRRHYCFSYIAYRKESADIAEVMAKRYGPHPAVQAWQIDNEYSCHDTARSYSRSAKREFRRWLQQKYSDIDTLNCAWGNVFWSMEYRNFDDIELPNQTVTEANPSHWLDFHRFSSDQVVAYNRAQVEVLRKHTKAPLIHNYMGRIVDFDHFKVGGDLDIASWDSYPLGFLVDRLGADQAWQQRFERQGDPDLQAFHHDLYRSVGRGRWWVMEQQPGPVNWAPNNPAPLDGMVRLWTLEAIAHQAEAVCYFRWRQAPFAQEQMHAGLLRPDSEEAAAFDEVRSTALEIQELKDCKPANTSVALIFDYESCWAWEVQAQGEDFDQFSLCFEFYRGLRRLGLNVDIIPANADISKYQLVLCPGLFAWTEGLLQQIEAHTGLVLMGPRSGSKTVDFHIPQSLPPNIPFMDCKVTHVESFAQGCERQLEQGGEVRSWFEALESTEQVVEKSVDGAPVIIRRANHIYLAAWPDEQAMVRILEDLCQELSINVKRLPEGVRQRRTGSHTFLFNHNAESVDFDGDLLAPASVKIEPIV